jgi:hypothetical protein
MPLQKVEGEKIVEDEKAKDGKEDGFFASLRMTEKGDRNDGERRSE